MTCARLSLSPEREFELVGFRPTTAEWTLYDHARGEQIVVFESHLEAAETVEVRCDFCGRWSSDSVPATSDPHPFWVCFGAAECAESRHSPELARR